MGGLAELGGAGGVSWWQTLGGLAVVFGLLVLSMRLLGRFHRRQSGGRAALLGVWPLGPKREIQLLRLAEDVHYVYRHDGAMVVLDREPLATFEARRDAAAPAAPARGGLPDLTRLKALVARSGASSA